MKNTNKAVVLLSGGLDSTTALAMAVKKHGRENVFALNIMYGQKHDKELRAAQKVADYYNVDYKLMDLSGVFAFSNSPLLKHSDKAIKHQSYAEQLKELGGSGTVDTYVPFRNGLMLSTAGSYALSVGASLLYYGAHKDDSAGRAYPDCTEEFVNHMSLALFDGSGGLLEVRAPFIQCSKAQIVTIGLALMVPYDLTWSCYEGNAEPCETCGTCIDRKSAFALNSIEDPIYKYKV